MALPTKFDGLETRSDVLSRVRRRLSAAGTRGGKTWDELFSVCDRNRDGSLDFGELNKLVREELKVASVTVCEYELKILFSEVDKNGSGNIDAAELIEFIQHGAKRPQDEAAKFEQRLSRVRRNLRLAFQAVSGKEMDVRKLFGRIDLDSDNRLTFYEFNQFVRVDLNLSRWDVMAADLDHFYKYLDRDGDGIDVYELIRYVKEIHGEGSLLGAQTFYSAGNSPKRSKAERTHKTYKQNLEQSVRRSSSLPSLALTHPFGCQGRDRRPAFRVS